MPRQMLSDKAKKEKKIFVCFCAERDKVKIFFFFEWKKQGSPRVNVSEERLFMSFFFSVVFFFEAMSFFFLFFVIPFFFLIGVDAHVFGSERNESTKEKTQARTQWSPFGGLSVTKRRVATTANQHGTQEEKIMEEKPKESVE